MKITHLLYIIIVVMLFGCKSNDIYIDFRTMSIKSTDGDIINRLRIENSQTSSYVMIIKDANKKGSDSINIFNPNDAYYIEDKMYRRHSLPITLLPNSTYVISNISYGDAGICQIRIRTDSVSMFIKNSYEPHYIEE